MSHSHYRTDTKVSALVTYAWTPILSPNNTNTTHASSRSHCKWQSSGFSHGGGCWVQAVAPAKPTSGLHITHTQTHKQMLQSRGVLCVHAGTHVLGDVTASRIEALC